VLHRIRHIDARPIDARCRQCSIENLTRRTDKWTSRNVLGVSRLLADEYDVGITRAFTEDGLRGWFEERAAAAPGGRLSQRSKIIRFRNERARRDARSPGIEPRRPLVRGFHQFRD
jgi:hypothetical protein